MVSPLGDQHQQGLSHLHSSVLQKAPIVEASPASHKPSSRKLCPENMCVWPKCSVGPGVSRRSLVPVSGTDRCVIQEGGDQAPVLRKPSSLIPSGLRKASVADLGSLQRQAVHGELSGQGVWPGEPLGVKTLRKVTHCPLGPQSTCLGR